MPKQKELPAMLKPDKSASLAIEVLEIRSKIKDLREELDEKYNELAEDLTTQDRASIRVNFEGEDYFLEVQHVDEHEKIKIKKG